MATYIFLADAWVNNQYIQAGTTQSTQDAGGILPWNWIPIPDVDPVDLAAIWMYWAQGPRPRGLMRQQWVGLPVPVPKNNWTQNANGQWLFAGVSVPPAPAPFLVNEQGQPLINEQGQFLVGT